MDKTSIYSKDFIVIVGDGCLPYISSIKYGEIDLETLFAPFSFLSSKFRNLGKQNFDEKHMETFRDILHYLINNFTELEDFEIPSNYEKVYIMLKFWYLISQYHKDISTALDNKFFHLSIDNNSHKFNSVDTFIFRKCPEDVESLFYMMEYNPEDFIIFFLTNEIFEILNYDDLLLLNEYIENKDVKFILNELNTNLTSDFMLSPGVSKLISKILKNFLKELKKQLLTL